ncbi:MAG: hypothetical protein EOP02_36945 [Proteobacteria bacterium]|nr:MAG: hypothetical protein EOP02_36945 [Pseudomonadota bacterium]
MASPRDQRSDQAQTYRHLYRTKRWKETRADQLRRHPLCAMCLPRVTAATICNHVDKDAKQTEEGFFAGPFNSLCATHHDSTQQRDERRIDSGKLPIQACGPDGWPL